MHPVGVTLWGRTKLNKKSITPKSIGLVAIIAIVLMAITPAFVQVGAYSDALSVVNQMFIVGLVMTIFYSSWKVNKSEPISTKTVASQSKVLILGITYGLIVVVINGIIGGSNSLLTGDLDPTNFYLIMLAGVSEELFFRGFLQNVMKTFIRSIWVIVPSALVFAGFHWFRYGADPVSIGIMFALGLGFGAVYEISNDIGAPITAHVVNNGFSVLPMLITVLSGGILWIGVLVLVLVVSIILGMRKKG